MAADNDENSFLSIGGYSDKLLAENQLDQQFNDGEL
jgi:hypothetical protein